MYSPGHLTQCVMVFALGSDGACVYHWPFHTWSNQYIQKMHQAIVAHAGTVHTFYGFGMDAPVPSLVQEEERSWRAFQQSFATEFGGPLRLYLVEEPYTNPPLKLAGGAVTTVMPSRQLV